MEDDVLDRRVTVCQTPSPAEKILSKHLHGLAGVGVEVCRNFRFNVEGHDVVDVATRRGKKTR